MASNNVFGLDELKPGQPPEDADPFADSPVIEAKVEELEEIPETTGEDPLAPKAEEPEEPVEAAAPEEPEAEEPETALDEAEPEPEPEGTPYTGRYGEKYKTIEAMEEAHRNALDLSQRQAQRAKQVEAQNAELMEAVRLAAQYIEEQQKQAKVAPKATPTELQAEAEKYGVDVETLQVARQIAADEAARVAEPLQQELAQTKEQWQRQQYAEAAAQRATQEITNFRTLHADVLNEEVEQSMVDVFTEFDLDPQVSDNYEIAFEAAQNPQLREVLTANPTYIDTDAGMNFARRLAGTHTVTAPSSREAELTAARKRATVEGGNAGAPSAPTERATDPAKDPNSWEAVLQVASKDRKTSAFGV